MVRELKSHKLMEPFLEPLDPVALGLEGYTDIVKQPMDLKTVGAKNDGGEYAGKDALKADVELMFNNAAAYNGADHWIATENVAQLRLRPTRFSPPTSRPRSRRSRRSRR